MENAFCCATSIVINNDNMYAFANSSRHRESTIAKLRAQRVSLSHLIIKWLWVICERYSNAVCRDRPNCADDRVVLRARFTFVWGALATAKNKYNDATLMSGTEIGATGNEKRKRVSHSLLLACLGSLLWVKSETGVGTKSCVFSPINAERSKVGCVGLNTLYQKKAMGFGRILDSCSFVPTKNSKVARICLHASKKRVSNLNIKITVKGECEKNKSLLL